MWAAAAGLGIIYGDKRSKEMQSGHLGGKGRSRGGTDHEGKSGTVSKVMEFGNSEATWKSRSLWYWNVAEDSAYYESF